MIVDSSAIISILLAETDHHAFIEAIEQSRAPKMAAPTLLEVEMVVVIRKGDVAREMIDLLLSELRIAIIPFTEQHAAVARGAFLRFGKGRHPAALNFGDCIAYASAKREGMPLLFKGDDFRLTDIEAAL